MMRGTRFSAPWSREVVWISEGTTLAGVVLTLGWWTGWLRLPGNHAFVQWMFLLFFPALLAGTAPFMIRGYEITENAIVIRRLFWSTCLPRQGIVSATADCEAFCRCLRVCGNGGLYSVTGWYWSRRLGLFRAYVTDPKRTVILRYARRTVALSPGDPDEFVRMVAA